MSQPSNFISYVFVFLIGMVISFVILLGSSVMKDSYQSEYHIERISLVLQAMEQDLLRMENQVMQTQSQLNSLQNKVSAEQPTASASTESPPMDSVTPDSATFAFLALSARDQSMQSGSVMVHVEKGTGQVQIRDNPFLSDEVLAHAKVAAKVASGIAKVSQENLDITFEFKGPTQLLEADSLGALMTIGAYAAADHLDARQGILLSGAILSDGRIGPVGNLYLKAQEAAELGYSKMVIPKGQSRVTVYVDDAGKISTQLSQDNHAKVLDLKAHAKGQWGLDIIEIDTVYDAIPLLLK